MNPIVKWVMQTMMKGQTGVMRTLPDRKLLDLNVNMTVERLIRNNIDPSTIKTPGQLDNIIKQIEQPRVIPADSKEGKKITDKLLGKKGEVVDMTGKKIKPRSKIMGGKEVTETNDINKIIADIKGMEPTVAMKEANSVIGRKGQYKNLTPEQSKKILQDTEDHIFQRDPDNLYNYDPEDMADGGVAGLLGERPGYNKGLKVYPKITASKSNQGLGDGKNVDLQDLTYGGTLMYDQGPFSVGIEYLKGKDKFDFKDKDDTLFKDTTDRELANLILMMKLKDGSIKFKGNEDNQMINFSKSFAQGGPARTGYKNGNGVADEDAEKAALGKRVRQLMDEEGYDFGEAVKEAMKEGYADGGPARQNFKMGRRAFLGLIGSVGAGIAGLKSGLLGLGKGGAKKAVSETVKQTAGSGTPPPYFFKLVEKIKTMGDDVTPNYATKDREVVKKYKDFEMTEDVSTGEITIQRQKPSDFEYYDEMLNEDVYMSYKPGKSQMDETTKGKTPLDEYTEDTSYIRTSGPQKGDIYDTVDGIPDDVLEEAGEKIIEKKIKSSPLDKADGGRIGFYEGGDYNRSKMKELADAFARQKYGRTLTDLPDVKRFEMEDLAIKSLSKDIEKKADGGLAAMLGE
jgi:hypothetical protein